jgi:superfamily II RNA helicase
MALEEAIRQLEPKAVRVMLPSATIKNEGELEAWVDEVKSAIKAKLKDGPVII